MTRRLVALFGCALYACTDVIDHGTPVTVSVHQPSCDPQGLTAPTSLHVRVTELGSLVYDEVTTTVAGLKLPPAADVQVEVEGLDASGAVVAIGSSRHFALAEEPSQVSALSGEAPRREERHVDLAIARSGHAVSQLSDGRVVVVGGRDGTEVPAASVEFVLDDAQPSRPVALTLGGAQLPLGLSGHTLSRAPGPQELVLTGGSTSNGVSGLVLFLDFSSGLQVGVVPPGAGVFGRVGHSAFVVSNTLVVAGGENATGPLGDLSRLDFTTISTTTVGALPRPRADTAFALLVDSLVVAGGESFDLVPLARPASATNHALLTPRRFARAATVGDRVLLVGGEGVDGGTVAASEWLRSDGSANPGPLLHPRVPACVLALSGGVLVVGGRDELGPTNLAEWVTANQVQHLPFSGPARASTACVALDDGSAILIGGAGANGPLGDVWRFVPPR